MFKKVMAAVDFSAPALEMLNAANGPPGAFAEGVSAGGGEYRRQFLNPPRQIITGCRALPQNQFLPVR